MNYGHKLKFGVFITPHRKEPESVVELSRLSDILGLDLVTIQDHFHEPAYLEAWTLMTWIAGQTERVSIAPTVLNIPYRLPATVARAAASLDLLSEGRLALALGAGELWDEIEANGGRRLAPPYAVDALGEAVDIIRSMLDAGDDTPIHLHGDYYSLDGARGGPVPTHDIPIWLRANDPQRLRLVGYKADGWLASKEVMKAGGFRNANQIIDDAAHEVMRDPREIRRLVNIAGRFLPSRGGFLQGPSPQWVEELLPFVINDGVGTFILKADEQATIERFAHEVVPALREAVAREFPGASLAPVVRRASVRAKRRAGIHYELIPASLADAVIEPGDPTYGRVKSTYMRGGSPGIIFMVKNVEQVRAALAFARAHLHLPLGIRSGGHGISGRSTNNGGIVINLSKMNEIKVLDKATRRVRIGAGARWVEVATALAPYGWALSSGDYGGVGVSGLATAGGIGWFVREHGLTIDHLRAVEMVLADGSVVRASEKENPDLFWAMRGAGANFGIVTSFEFEVDEVGLVGWAQLLFDASDTAGLLSKWGAAVEAAPRELTSFIILGPPRRGQPAVAQVMTVVDSEDIETISDWLQPIAEIAPLYNQNVVITSYANIMANTQGDNPSAEGEPIARSALIEHITPEFAAAAARLLRSGAVYFFQIRSVGGAVADVDATTTAYSNRTANFAVTAFGINRQRIDALWDELRPHFSGLYISFETDQRPERLHDAFSLQTLERLRALKARYDPNNLFRDNFNVA